MTFICFIYVEVCLNNFYFLHNYPNAHDYEYFLIHSLFFIYPALIVPSKPSILFSILNVSLFIFNIITLLFYFIIKLNYFHLISLSFYYYYHETLIIILIVHLFYYLSILLFRDILINFVCNCSGLIIRVFIEVLRVFSIALWVFRIVFYSR